MVDNGRAVLSDFKAVVLVMRNRRRDVRTEFERNVAQVGRAGALHERHRRFCVAFDGDVLGHVARRTAKDVDVVLDHQVLALVAALVHKHQRTLGLVEKLQGRLDRVEIGDRTTCTTNNSIKMNFFLPSTRLNDQN